MIEDYYSLTEPGDRRKILEDMLADNIKEAPAIKQLFDMRYAEQKKGQEPYADLFLKLWMDMWMRSRSTSTGFGQKKNRKEISKQIVSIGLSSFRNESEENREILYYEMCHLVRLFIYLCEKDRMYTHVFQGFVSIPKERLKEKVSEDVRATGINFMDETGLSEDLPELRKASEDILNEFSNR